MRDDPKQTQFLSIFLACAPTSQPTGNAHWAEWPANRPWMGGYAAISPQSANCRFARIALAGQVRVGLQLPPKNTNSGEEENLRLNNSAKFQMLIGMIDSG
ncbi:hypothetical protein [Bradyrhizobium sp. UNPF46]|uniref:hypothetical protein n=1 Tax=Bradyrhizobium sp. UNPF46 TaxID=1141168 RepID=UPI00114E34FF|nr:hypothetical protein [Bradyrhizobium sp. UNPF46]